MSTATTRRALLGSGLATAAAATLAPAALAEGPAGQTLGSDLADTPILNAFRQMIAIEARWQAFTDAEAAVWRHDLQREWDDTEASIMALPVTGPLDLLAKGIAWDGDGEFDLFAEARTMLEEALA